MGFVFHWVHGRCDACCTDGAVCVEVTARPPSTQRLRHASQACVQHVCHWPVLLPKPHVLFFFERLVTPQQLLSIQPLRTPLHSAQGLTDTQNDIYITSHHITSHHITSHHITSHHITSHHITSHHITSHHITSHHITSHHITSHHITSHHITSHHITSHHITSHHITSHHITSHHITSHHITSQTKETSAARHQDQTLFPVQQMMTLNNKALCCMLC